MFRRLLRLPTGSAVLLEHFQLDFAHDDICWLEDDVLRNGPVTLSILQVAFASLVSNLVARISRIHAFFPCHGSN